MDYSNVIYNVLGQAIDGSRPDLASGYYWDSDEKIAADTAAGLNVCPQGMRSGRLVIRGAPRTGNNSEGYVHTCNGDFFQQNLPDIYMVDWRYRIYADLGMVLIILILLVAITYKLFR